MKVFVYGSLMAGESNHSFLSDGESKYIGKGITQRKYLLYDLGGFPGMVAGGNNAILGEIYEVSAHTRCRLDRLEGHPQFYRRSLIKLHGGETVETYILDKAYIRGCPVIRSGNWQDR